MLFATAMTLFVLVMTIDDGGLSPWISWEHVHSDWLRVGQFARVLVPEYFWNTLLLTWYIVPITSVIFFAFFGLGQEAKAEHATTFSWVKLKVFRIKPRSSPNLPVSARVGVRSVTAVDLAVSCPPFLKLQGETTSTTERWDDGPTSTYTNSRPASPMNNTEKSTLESQLPHNHV